MNRQAAFVIVSLGVLAYACAPRSRGGDGPATARSTKSRADRATESPTTPRIESALAVNAASDYFGIELFPVVAGLGAFLGHLFPVWLRFKGGKGVATFIGIVFGLAWPVAFLTCFSWLGAAWYSRYSSLAALIAAALTPVYLYLWGTTLYALLAVLLALLIFFTHRSNIARLMKGAEPKIGAR